MSMPMRISSIMSMESEAAGESVPRPTRSPALRYLPTGATPMPSLALQRGQKAMATSRSASISMSSSSTCTQWMASTLGASRMPQLST